MNSYIWPIHGTPTGTTAPSQSGLESNGNLPQTPRLEPHHQMHFNVIPRTWSLWKNKIGIFPSCSCDSTIVWLDHLDFNEIFGEKARWELHKDAVCCFEQILEAALQKTAAIWPLTSPISQTIQVRWTRHAGQAVYTYSSNSYGISIYKCIMLLTSWCLKLSRK